MNESEGMHPPDWERYKVAAAGGGAPVGDPTRWGAQVFTPLDDNTGLVSTAQILQMSTRDNYARSWSVLGTLSLPTLTWNTADLLIQLEITLGVGQVQITHAVMLFRPALLTPPAGLPIVTSRGGLCLEQYIFYGGPYNAIGEANAAGSLQNQARAFAIVGGLVGQSISIRATYQVSTVPPVPGFPTTSRLAVIVSPYAAGEGL